MGNLFTKTPEKSPQTTGENSKQEASDEVKAQETQEGSSQKDEGTASLQEGNEPVETSQKDDGTTCSQKEGEITSPEAKVDAATLSETGSADLVKSNKDKTSPGDDSILSEASEKPLPLSPDACRQAAASEHVPSAGSAGDQPMSTSEELEERVLETATEDHSSQPLSHAVTDLASDLSNVVISECTQENQCAADNKMVSDTDDKEVIHTEDITDKEQCDNKQDNTEPEVNQESEDKCQESRDVAPSSECEKSAANETEANTSVQSSEEYHSDDKGDEYEPAAESDVVDTTN